MPNSSDVQELWTKHMIAALVKVGVDWEWVCDQAELGCAHELGITVAEVNAAMSAFHAPLDDTAHA